MENSTSRLGIGIVGYGNFANKWLKDAVSNSESAKLIAIQTSNSNIKINGVVCYQDIDDILIDSSIDAIIVASPNGLHCKHTCEALQAGKHVLCEKPVSIWPSEARHMANVARLNKRYLAVGHMLRYSPALQKVKEILLSNRLGEVLYAQASCTYCINQNMRTWCRDENLAGGGALLDGGVHCLDALRYLFGEIYPKASLIKSRMPSIEYGASALLVSETGINLHVNVFDNAAYQSTLEIVGVAGRLRVDGFARCAGNVLITVADEENRNTSIEEIKIIVDGVYTRQIDYFVKMISTRPDDEESILSGMRNIEIAQNLYKMAK